MNAKQIAILSTGLVSPVGLTAAESCAALRAKTCNPTETRFMDERGEWIMAHQVVLAQPWRGLTKLARMAAMAIGEALQCVPRNEWSEIPLLMCVAEADRPGRPSNLDDGLLPLCQEMLSTSFGARSAILAHGRIGVASALAEGRGLLSQGTPRVLLAAVDSLVSAPTLRYFDRQDRLLRKENSNGFIPGEAAGAVLLGVPSSHGGALLCTGIGFGHEPAPIESDEPLRAEGLSQAFRAAVADAGCGMQDMDFRIADIAGEHYYFKEATLALSRTLRTRKEEFDIWHPAECIGEVGAAAGIAILAVASAACEKGYSKGTNILAHMSNDAGQRAALSLRYRAIA